MHLLELVLKLFHSWRGWKLFHSSFQVAEALGHVDQQVKLFQFADTHKFKGLILHFLFKADSLQVEPDAHFFKVFSLLELGFPQSEAQNFVESRLALLLALLFRSEQTLELESDLMRGQTVILSG